MIKQSKLLSRLFMIPFRVRFVQPKSGWPRTKRRQELSTDDPSGWDGGVFRDVTGAGARVGSFSEFLQQRGESAEPLFQLSGCASKTESNEVRKPEAAARDKQRLIL